MKVYFMRHAESEYNIKRLINQDPKIKVALSRRGVKQAEETAAKLSKFNFDAIFSSPFLRCRQTVEIVNKFHNAKIKIDGRIGEIKVGFEGRSADEYEKLAFAGKRASFKIKGEESWLEVQKRVKDFLDWLSKQKYNCVLVVTHQDTMNAAIGLMKKIDSERASRMSLKNCEIFEFKI